MENSNMSMNMNTNTMTFPTTSSEITKKSIYLKDNISLTHKRKRDQFHLRLDSLISLPNIIKSKFTYATFTQELCTPILLKKTNPPVFPLNTSLDIQQEVSILKNEIDEIVNELEFFNRTNRQKRTIKMMEKIADNINEDLIDVGELLDYKFLGDKVCHIEKEYKDKLNQNNYKDKEKEKEIILDRLGINLNKCNHENNLNISGYKKFSEYTNRLLLDDDEVFVNKKNSGDESSNINTNKEVSSNKIFKIHQINK